MRNERKQERKWKESEKERKRDGECEQKERKKKVKEQRKWKRKNEKQKKTSWFSKSKLLYTSKLVIEQYIGNNLQIKLKRKR